MRLTNRLGLTPQTSWRSASFYEWCDVLCFFMGLGSGLEAEMTWEDEQTRRVAVWTLEDRQILRCDYSNPAQQEYFVNENMREEWLAALKGSNVSDNTLSFSQ